MKVLLFENVNAAAVEKFKSAGFEVETLPTKLDPSELIKKISDVEIFGHRSQTKLDAEILTAAKNLKASGVFGVGTNKIDLKTAAQIGVPVFNGANGSTRSVAELAVGFIFQLFRKVAEKNIGAHRGEWLKKVDGFELRNKIVGVVGFSNIGSQVGAICEAIGMRVVFSDPAPVLPRGNCEKVSFEKLLEISDVVSIHVPSLPSTKNLFDEKIISKMKTGAFLINTARGDVWDENAICENLKSGKLGGVATDVFPAEPKNPTEKLNSKLCKFENAILTPHIGGSTREAQKNMGAEVAEKVVNFFETKNARAAINFHNLQNLRI